MKTYLSILDLRRGSIFEEVGHLVIVLGGEDAKSLVADFVNWGSGLEM